MEANNKYKKSIILILCFLIPTLVMLAAFATYGMAPFGEKSILIMDMSGQYSEFFIGLKHLGKNSNIFFSWSKSLGTNYIGVFAFYLSSPLSFLTLFSTDANMPIFLLFLTVLKIGLCGLTFGLYLNYMHKPSFRNIIFSLFYALMSYTIVYSMCVKWIDGVIWLPIILIGIEELMKKNKMKLLIISLFVMFISSYYISYMIGLFACIYFIYRYITHYSDTINIKQTSLKFVSSAIISALLASWLLLPTLASLFEGKIGGNNYVPKETTTFKLSDIISKLYLGAYDSITNSGMPFLYTSILVTILFIGFFFLKKISIKEKVATFVVSFILLASMYFTITDIAWHVFQAPNWFPYRYSFVFLFFTVYIAYRTFISIKDIHLSFLISFPIVGLITSVLIKKINYPYVNKEQISLSLKILLFYSVCLIVLYALSNIEKLDNLKKFEIIIKRIVPVFIIFTMLSVGCYEIYRHSLYMFAGLDRMHHYEEIEPYQLYRKSINTLLDEATKTEDENSFYRMTSNFGRSFNEPISFGYKGIAHYSSAYSRDVNILLRKLGVSSSYLWCTGYGTTIVTDSLLSIKYLMSIKPETTHYEKLSTQEKISLYRKPEDNAVYKEPKDITIYKNPNSLSVAFMADKNARRINIDSSNYFVSQNKLIQSITGDNNSNCFIRQPLELEYENVTIDDEKPNVYIKIGGKQSIIKYKGIASKDIELYAQFPLNNNKQGCSVYVNNIYITELYHGQFDCAHFLGSFKKGDEINVELRFNTSIINVSNNMFYSLDYKKFEDITSKLKEGNLNISSYSAGKIKGSVYAKEDGILFTSIPYNKGWKVYVDGKKQKTLEFADTLLCVEITQGEHNVVLKYKPYGLALGSTLSILTLLSLILFSIRHHKKKKSST